MSETVTVVELAQSREGQFGLGGSVDLRYKVTGTSDDAVASLAVVDASPNVYQGLLRNGYPRMRALFVDVGNSGACVWEATQTYSSAEQVPTPTGESTFSFDTGGATEHVICSKETVGAYGWADPAHTSQLSTGTFGGLIGVSYADNGNMELAGADIPVRFLAWEETHHLHDAYMTASYERTLYELTGTVNNAGFAGSRGGWFGPGNVLLDRVHGGQRGTEDWEITFAFQARRELRNAYVAGFSGVWARGWEYIWPVMGPQTFPGDRVAVVPIGLMVERMFDYGDFSRLGIR